MVKTRRKNYISFDDEDYNMPVHFINKKTSPKACRNINFLDLSNEILIKITGYLSFDSLSNLRLVCHRLNEISAAVLTETSKTIIARYRQLVKFSPSNLHPDLDACGILQLLCLLERDMKIYNNAKAIYLPILVQVKATELLNLIAESLPENSSLKEEQTKTLVLLVYKIRSTFYAVSKRNLISANLSNTKPRHKPITYP